MKEIIHFIIRFFSPPILIIVSVLALDTIFEFFKIKKTDIYFDIIAIIIVFTWLIFIIYELRRFHIRKYKGLRNINIVIIIIYLFLAFITNIPSKIYDEKSPDGNYRIKIYKKTTGVFITMPGDGGFHEVTMKLYDKKGQKVRESCGYCPVSSYSNKIYWNIDKKYVSYGHCSLKLSKGECN